MENFSYSMSREYIEYKSDSRMRKEVLVETFREYVNRGYFQKCIMMRVVQEGSYIINSVLPHFTTANCS